MARTRWFEPLLAFLRDYPGETETVTLTLTEIETLVGKALPKTALIRSYWWKRQPGTMGPRLAAVGWRVVQARRPNEDLTIMFARVTTDTTA